MFTLKAILSYISCLLWKRGWILNSLKFQIEKQLRESIYDNITYKKIRWNHIEKRFLNYSKHPFRSICGCVIVFTVLQFLLLKALPYLNTYFPDYSLDHQKLYSWLTTILECQVTVLGLVFPLVIALIGINLQSVSANRALWDIYKNYSSLFHNGISGLLLVGVIVFTEFLRPFLTSEQNIIVSAGLFVWFLYNVELLCWFLYVTVDFVSIEKRSNLLLRYSINEIFLDDIRLRLSKIIPQHAVLFGLINAKEEIYNITDNISSREPLVRTYSEKNNRGNNELTITFKNDKYLNNIYFRVLNLGVQIWKKSLATPSTEMDTILSLPIYGWDKSNDVWNIAISSNGKISTICKMLFRLSYTFRRTSFIDTSSFNKIINALVGNIEDALKENNHRLFKISIDEIIKWHNKITECLSFYDKKHNLDNWMLLKDGSYFGRSYLDELTYVYWQLIKNSLQKFSVNRAYFEEFCYLYLQIYGFQNEKFALGVRTDLISSHASTWSILVNWYSSNDIESNDRKIIRDYRAVIRTFVGSWENWPERICPYDENEILTNEMVESLVHHLRKTSQIVYDSIIHKETYSKETSVDLLLNWYDKTFWKNDSHLFFKHQELLTHLHIKNNDSHPLWKDVLKDNSVNYNDLVVLTLHNAWIDIRLITALYIINDDLGVESQSLDKHAEALINGVSFYDTGSLRSIKKCINSGKDALCTYLKHIWFCLNDENSYSDWLNSVVHDFYHLKPRPPQISGRIYSGIGGPDGVRHLSSSYILISILNSNNVWTLSKSFEQNILCDFVTYEANKRILWNLEDWICPDVEIIKRCLLILGHDSLNRNLKNYLTSIDNIKEIIDKFVTAKVAEADLDIKKLLEISKQASSEGFNLHNKYVPTSLFKSIDFIQDLNEANEYSMAIGNYHKESIAKDVLSSSSHLDSWYSDNIAKNVRDNLYRLFLTNVTFSVLESLSIADIFADIVDKSKKLRHKNLTPICFVGAELAHKLLNENIWKGSRETEQLPYNIYKDETISLVDYKCNIEDLEVFRLPFTTTNYCLLTTKEAFVDLRLRENIHGKYVNTYFIPSKDNKSLGTLKLSYWMSASFMQLPAYKYIVKGE